MLLTIRTPSINRSLIAQKLSGLKYENSEFISKKLKDYCELNSLSTRTSNEKPKKVKIKIQRIALSSKQHQKVQFDTCQSQIVSRQNSGEKVGKRKTQSQQNPQMHIRRLHHWRDIKLTGLKSITGSTFKWKTALKQKTSRIMRVGLIDRLMELAASMDLSKIVVYNAVNYADSLVNLVQFAKDEYEAIGLCSLFIASKLETAENPCIQHFLQALIKKVKKNSFMNLELRILQKLRYKLNPPNLYRTMENLLDYFKHFRTVYKMVDLPNVHKSCLQRQIYWFLQGVLLDQNFKKFSDLQICLSIMYLVMRKYENGPINVKNIRKLLSALQGITIGKLQINFQSFIAFSEQDIKTLSQIVESIKALSKWVRFECDCQCQGNEGYHPELKQIVSRFF